MSQIADFIAENLSTFKQNQIFSPQIWKYFSRSISGKNSVLLTYLLENKSVANSKIGNDVVDKAIIGAYYQNLMMYLIGRKELTKEEVQEAAKTIKLLADQTDKAQLLTADVAVLYADKKIEEIAKMYKFMNFTSYNIYEV